MSQINGELERLQQAMLFPDQVRAADLIVEEISARSQALKRYSWDDACRSACTDLAEGGSLELSADESLRRVVFHFNRSNVGTEKYSSISKWNTAAMSRAQDIFKTAGWTLDEYDVARNAIHLRCHLSIDTVMTDLDRTVATIDRAARELRYRASG